MQTGMVSQDAVIAQRDIFLFPLLVKGFATPLQKDSLEEKRHGGLRAAGRRTRAAVNVKHHKNRFGTNYNENK